MTTTGPVWSSLLSLLVSEFTTLLPDVSVSLGPAQSMNAGDYLEVGVSDPSPTAGGPHSAATYEVEWDDSVSTFGFTESGTVTCGLWSWHSADELALSLESVAAIESAVARWLQTDIAARPSSLGSLGIWQARLAGGGVEVDVRDGQATAYQVIRIAYDAHIQET